MINIKLGTLVPLIICCLALSSCKAQSDHIETYKGKALFETDLSSLFIEEKSYKDKPVDSKLAQRFDEFISKLNPNGISVSVAIPGKGTWNHQSGFANKKQGIKVDQQSLFYWASVGKMFTSVVINQLIQERKLRMDSPLSKWFPSFKFSYNITILDLLVHTSGIYSFNYDESFNSSPNLYYSPDQLIAIAQKAKPLFKPGENWSYSNTNYLLLALIAERTEHKPFAQIVQDRIVKPIGLTSVKVLAPKEQRSNLAQSHKNGEVMLRDYSVPLGAGNLVGNAADMVKFHTALLSNTFFNSPVTSALFAKMYPMFEKGMYYGQGIMCYNFPEIDGSTGKWIGHSGGIPDYKSAVILDQQTRIIVAVSVNETISAEAIANNLIKLAGN
ncbi:D-alanyl-D-alanine carboxypeptidase [Pedobacter africanus]|uniref:D-alanyl-D-alanine carboxypeptidase n=1 Tax=Pedobacter africanus TaxID=151894 RepID=A0ACC6L035_9SPHI|nr:serine hydrolase domain-containing protein [Pedobacter africanus]MDR6784990.1 D-alanyl-D-alanine carboxypeptidase [Pedobacter africanus]